VHAMRVRLQDWVSDTTATQQRWTQGLHCPPLHEAEGTGAAVLPHIIRSTHCMFNSVWISIGACSFLLPQVKDLLLPFGVLKAFNLVMDKNTGNSKVPPCLCIVPRLANAPV
jgi:hypothetical protein